MSDKLTRADAAAIIRLRSLNVEVNLRMDHEDQIIALAAAGPEPIVTYPRRIEVGDKVRVKGGTPTVGLVINWRESLIDPTDHQLYVEFCPPGNGGTYKLWVAPKDLELVNEA